MKFSEKPLGYVKDGLEKMGRAVSHVYEDLIFPDHAAYLIQFGADSRELKLYFNKDCPGDEAARLRDELTAVFAGEIGFSLCFNGTFALEQQEEEQLRLTFSK